MPGRQIYLVPGFFGFSHLGELNYFRGVSEVLGRALARRGVEATVIECETQPTGSIRRRTERLLETVMESGGLEADELHFVGHSTGGLDIRLLVTPGVRLHLAEAEAQVTAHTRSIISLATPHHGTPLANFFLTFFGRNVLEAVAVAATTRGGRYAIYNAARALRLVSRLDDLFGRDNTFLDMWVKRFFDDITLERGDSIWQFFQQIATDQGAIIQLTPESMHLFAAAVTDHPDIRYSSVVTAAPRPPRAYRISQLLSPADALVAALFTLLHTMTSRENRHYPYPMPPARLLGELRRSLPFGIEPRTNDGVVPTMSQIYGRVLGVVLADHLDVVGQYDNGEPHSDWLPSGARYDDARFEHTWDVIAEEIVRAGEAGRDEQATASASA